MNAIELQGVSKSFGSTSALEHVDLKLEEGKTSVLIGQSGCGKSTILRLIVGLVRPDSGRVLVHGEALTPDSLEPLRRRMGYVIQEGGLFPHLTARRNVSLMAHHLGQARTQIDTRIDELCDLTHFPADGLDRFPAELSGGQRQRVSLMRALMLDPDLLLLDEPLGALDPMIRADLQDELREIFRSLGKTVVLVTHDLAEAGHFADEMVFMDSGEVVQSGTLEDFVKRPARELVSRFVNAQRSPLSSIEP